MSWQKGLLKNVALPLAAGAAGAWVVWSLTQAPGPKETKAGAPVAPPASAADLGPMKARLDRIERAQLLAGPTPVTGAVAKESPSAPELTPEPAPIEERKKQRRELAASLRQEFEQDARDPRWAPNAERSFDADLRNVNNELGTTTRSVGCKTTHCYAEVEAKDLSSGRRAAAALMRGEFAMSCLRTAVVIDEETQPVKLAVGLDCTESRAEAP
jgi:hypothetical protein